MDINKNFLTIDEQINLLTTNGITIKNKNKVKNILENNSYYNIINGYREPFLFMKNTKKYIRNVNFMEIFSLYEFDIKLRNILFPHLLEIEKTIKTKIIYSFSSKTDTNGNLVRTNDDYLKIDNYDFNLPIKNRVNVIAEIQKTIAKYVSNSSPSITHYLTKYAYVPLWVLSTYMTFGNISKFYDILEIRDRQNVSKQYLLAENELRTFLKVLTLARNNCAHSNRLYCMTHTYTLPTLSANKHINLNSFIINNRSNKKLFSVIICMSIFLDSKKLNALKNSIDNEINILSKKLKVIQIDKILDIMGFPSDWKDLI